jgi:hypothetical protein
MSSSGVPDRVVTDAFRLFRRGVLADENSSELTDFFNALVLAGFVDGAKHIDTDLRESDRLLVGLKRRDSSNGANAFFRAAVLSELGVGKDAVRSEFLEAFRAPRFDTHTTSLGRAIREKGYTSASHFALAGMIIYKMPVPNYLFVSRLIHQFLEEKDREFAKSAVAFARTLMRPALEVGGDHEHLNWSALEYAIGSNLLAKAWAIAYPNHPEPNYPSYMDILRREERVEGLFALALDDFRDLSAMARSGECRRANYDALFEAERAAYLEFSGQ